MPISRCKVEAERTRVALEVNEVLADFENTVAGEVAAIRFRAPIPPAFDGESSMDIMNTGERFGKEYAQANFQ
jgi:hypothetical protein